MAYLRTVSGIPIMADESVFTLADAWNVLRAGAADIISVYPGKNGGISASIEIAHVAAAAGIACHIGSNLELGIGSAAMLHLACAVPAIDSAAYPADILGPHYHEADLADCSRLRSIPKAPACRMDRAWESSSTRSSSTAFGSIAETSSLRPCPDVLLTPASLRLANMSHAARALKPSQSPKACHFANVAWPRLFSRAESRRQAQAIVRAAGADRALLAVYRDRACESRELSGSFIDPDVRVSLPTRWPRSAAGCSPRFSGCKG